MSKKTNNPLLAMQFDVFVSHASEDKVPLVRALAHRLAAQYLTVWYDEYELQLGDSLRQTIDRGLAESRFGIVVLSKAFFAKNWPQYELDGLIARENALGGKVLLPLWHEIDAAFISRFSPSLANRFAVSTTDGLESVVAAILRVVRPSISPIVAARNELILRGFSAPSVTDEYWLDVVEASNRVPATGAGVPGESVWGRWTFPLPPLDGTPETRGLRLARTALQLAWVDDAEASHVDLCTEPDAIHELIGRHSGLAEACEIYPELVAEYAPQLTIPGYGGSLELVFEHHYQASIRQNTIRSSDRACAEEWMLRHPALAGYSDHSVAYNWFSGGMFGPDVRLHTFTDYLFWLLSSRSEWLPARIRKALCSGIVGMSNAWLWYDTPSTDESDDRTWKHRGALTRAFIDAGHDSADDLVWTPEVHADLVGYATASALRLTLPESPADLVETFQAFSVTQKALASDPRHRMGIADRPGEPRAEP